jgi:hypothetical protein
MGKIILRDVKFKIDVPAELDPNRSFDIEGEDFKDVKETGLKLQKDIAEEFDINTNDVHLIRNMYKGNRFVIF